MLTIMLLFISQVAVQEVLAGGQQSVPQAVPVQDNLAGAMAQARPVSAQAISTRNVAVNI